MDRQAGDVLGIHVWTLTRSSGGTHVHIDKSWEGPELPASIEVVQAALGESQIRWLSSLKRERKLRTERAEAAGMS